MKKIITLTFFSLLTSICIFGQSKKVGNNEFYQPIRNNYQLRKNLSYRKKTKNESFSKGKLHRTETELMEREISGNMRYVQTIKTTVKTIRTETIKINDTFYCKKNNEKWKISKRWCGGNGFWGFQNVISSSFTVENVTFNGKPARLYKQFTKHKGHKPVKGKIFFYEDMYWLNENKLIVERKMTYGIHKPKKSVGSKKTTIYEYNPLLEIKAPAINIKN